MKTIATFSKPEEAHLLRMRLEAGGIAAYVQDENLIQADWFYSNAIGGVRVQVAEEDLARVEEILADEGEPLPGVVLVCCPYCNSTDVGPDESRRRLSFLAILFLLFPLPFVKNRYRCHECNAQWNERKRP